MEISSWNFGWGRIIPPLFWCNEVSEWKSLLLWNASNPVNQVKRGRYLSVLKKYIFDWITPQPLFNVGANFIKNDNIIYINISYRRVCFFVSFFVWLFACFFLCWFFLFLYFLFCFCFYFCLFYVFVLAYWLILWLISFFWLFVFVVLVLSLTLIHLSFDEDSLLPPLQRKRG